MGATIQTQPIIIDISSWNVSFNPQVFKENGHAVLIRCQYGLAEDRKFREFRKLCEDWGIPWSPYMFWLANVDPVKQIKLFMKLTGHWDVIGGKEVWFFDGKLGAYMDMENGTRPLTMTKATLHGEWEKLVKKFYEYTEIQIGVYTSAGWWNANIPDMATDLPKNGLPEVGRPIDLWDAHWGVNVPTIPREWLKGAGRGVTYILHQHNVLKNQAARYGVGGHDIDVNNFHFGLSEFNKRYKLNLKPIGVSEPGTPPPTPVTLPAEVVVVVSQLMLRNAPTASSVDTIVGALLKDARINPDGMVTATDGKIWYYKGEKEKKLFFAAWLTKPV